MALDVSGPAPYAPVRAITMVIEFARNKGIKQVDLVALERIGIEASLVRRTLAALKQLDLLNEEGQPTETFEKIRLAPSDQYHVVLAEWLQEAYKPILTYVEPTSEVQKIVDQFRPYEPAGQRNRMATLFLGLCAYSGLIEEPPPMPRGAKRSGAPSKKAASTTRATTKSEGTRTPPAGPKHNPPPDTGGVRQRYVDLLLEKAAEQDTPDPELLDRIERALGIAPTPKGVE